MKTCLIYITFAELVTYNSNIDPNIPGVKHSQPLPGKLLKTGSYLLNLTGL